jgi:hypothetical protein
VLQEDDLLGEPREVDGGHREHARGLGGEVAGTGGVDGVVGRGVESEFGRDLIRIQSQRRSGQSAGAVGRDRRALVEVTQSLDVPQQRVGMGQQLMRQQHRLRRLRVRLTRHRGVRMRLRLRDKRIHDVEHAAGDHAHCITQPHPEQRGHLVVPRTAGPQPATDLGPDPLDQSTLERAVHVLIGFGRDEGAGRDIVGQPRQAVQHRRQVGVREQSGPVEHPGMRLRCANVVRRQRPVEMRGLAERGHRVGRSGREPAAPQRALVGRPRRRHRPRSRFAAIFDDRPCSWTKPLAFDWSKVSPSS